MINFKIAGFAAGAALLISFLIGLASGVSIAIIIIRSLIFAGVFFGIACGAWYLFNTYLLDSGLPSGPFALERGPSLLDRGSGEEPGPRIDISVGEDEDEALDVNSAADYTISGESGFSDETAAGDGSNEEYRPVSEEDEEGGETFVKSTISVNDKESLFGENTDGKKMAGAIQTLLSRDDKG
jgi:hypothetical protein